LRSPFALRPRRPAARMIHRLVGWGALAWLSVAPCALAAPGTAAVYRHAGEPARGVQWGYRTAPAPVAGPSAAPAANAARAARGLLAMAAARVGTSAADWQLADIRCAGRLTHVHFRPDSTRPAVEGAYLTISVDAHGSAVAYTACLPPVEAGISRAARVDRAAALDRARAALGEPGAVAWREVRLCLWPAALSGRAATHLVWRIVARTEMPPRLERLRIDAHSGMLLSREPLLGTLLPAAAAPAGSLPTHSGNPATNLPPLGVGRAAEFVAGDSIALRGQVFGRVHLPDPWGAEVEVPFSQVALELRRGEVALAAAYSDTTGRFAFAPAAGESLELWLALAGRGASVRSGDVQQPPASLRLPVTSDSLAVRWDASAATTPEREAYRHVQAARARLLARDPGFDSPARRLDRSLPIVVDDLALDCNAYALLDPVAPLMRFAPAGGGCVSLGRLASVVEHEYAHLVTLYAYAPRWAPEPLQEAYADFFCAAALDTPCVGLGFQGPGSCVRDLEAELYWPVRPHCPEQPHCAGHVLASAWWDIRRALASAPAGAGGARTAEALVHRMRAAKPHDVETCLLHLLLADDDDGDLANGTPHDAVIVGAFEQRGLVDVRPRIAHQPPGAGAVPGAAYPLEATVSSFYPLAAGGVTLHHALNDGPFSAVAAIAGDEPGRYRAVLADLPAHGLLRYYWTARDATGHVRALPAEAPSGGFQVQLGGSPPAPTLDHRPPAPPVAGSTVGLLARVTPRMAGGDSVWAVWQAIAGDDTTRGHTALAPLASAAPESSATALVWTAEVPAASLTVGSRFRYQLHAGARTPGAPISVYPAAGWVEQFVRAGRAWPAGGEAGGLLLDPPWQRTRLAREAAPGRTAPLLLPRGDHAFAVLDSDFLSGEPALTLPAWSTAEPHARLVFSRWAPGDPAPEDPGGRIELSADGGASWIDITAEARPRPLFSFAPFAPVPGGVDPTVGWQRFEVPLDAHLPGPITLRLVTTERADRWFWIDDLRLAAEPALPPPPDLHASRGDPGAVDLTWTWPQTGPYGTDAFEGFLLYRGEAPGDYGAQPLHTEPLRTTHWRDHEVESGQRYFYALTGRFQSGESAFSPEACGHPFHATLGVPAQIAGRAGTDLLGADTLRIENRGTGELHCDIFPVTAGTAWESIRWRYERGSAPPGGFLRLGEDPAGDAPGPDLAYVAVREVSDNVTFRVGFHGPLPAPDQFTLFLMLDTDLSLATGITDPAVGADHLIAVGQAVLAATEGRARGYLLDAEGYYLDRATAVSLTEGADSLEVSVSFHALGSPEALALAARVADPADLPPWRGLQSGDRLPHDATPNWLEVFPRAGYATPEAPLPVTLRYDLNAVAVGTQRAELLILEHGARTPEALALRVAHPGQEAIDRLVLTRPYPNPFRYTTQTRVRIPAGVTWRLDVIDVTGRLVRALASGGAEDAAERDWSWDGRRTDGTRASSGLYYLVAQAGGKTAARSAVLIR